MHLVIRYQYGSPTFSRLEFHVNCATIIDSLGSNDPIFVIVEDVCINVTLSFSFVLLWFGNFFSLYSLQGLNYYQDQHMVLLSYMWL